MIGFAAAPAQFIQQYTSPPAPPSAQFLQPMPPPQAMPGMAPGMASWMMHGMAPQMATGMAPGIAFGAAQPGMTPDMMQGMAPGTVPGGMAPGMAPGLFAPMVVPGMNPGMAQMQAAQAQLQAAQCPGGVQGHAAPGTALALPPQQNMQLVAPQEPAPQQAPTLQELTVGEQVEMKNDKGSWNTGYVTCVSPLKVAYSMEGVGIEWKHVRSKAMAHREVMEQQQEALQQQQYMQHVALQQQHAMQQAAMEQQAMQYSMQLSTQKQEAALRQLSSRADPPRQLPPPPEEQTAADQATDVVNHYGTLDVETSADASVVKKAYRKLVLKWHPDKHPADRAQAEVKIRAINEAYEVLSNSTKRAAYNAQRDAIESMKQGARLPVDLEAQPRHDIPMECMLMPMGWPDKFVRFSGDINYSGSNVANCYAHSRADAKMDGGLSYFEPFFQACKLSFWWLPQVKNMCRIRAIEARTRSTRGEAVVAGRAGGMNLGFNIDATSMTDSGLVLMDARKGEKDDQVNFIVQPSPWYRGAWRFEAAEHRGWFLCFQPPTHLRMVKQAPRAISHASCVLDFTLVDFAVMYKFIDISEILSALLEHVPEPGWVSLEQVKSHDSITQYFMSILGVHPWSDEDFQTWFEAHSDKWEFVTAPRCMVRFRRPAQCTFPQAGSIPGISP